jgi:hypothetical protein
MVAQALAECAARCFNGDLQQARQALCAGRCEVCALLNDSLVRQVGEYLGEMDHTVRAVFRYEAEHPAGQSSLRSPQAAPGGKSTRKGGINLVTWVERKSAALSALSAALEAALAESRRALGCPKAVPGCYTLDIQMVDSREVQERRGYAVVINSAYLRSSQVWRRSGADDLPLAAAPGDGLLSTYDPELTPENVLFDQAEAIEKLSPAERQALEHRLREVKVVLIRRLISDQLAYINIAKDWFSIADLRQIHQRRIGLGKIGGKAAGMLLAARILEQVADLEIQASVHIPESYFLGSDVIYLFMAMNGLMHWNDQKYKPEEQIRSEYPQIKAEFETGSFPPEILDELRAVLAQTGRAPLIVRSSSQLEDNFGTAFAGKYDSHFCPNQGTPEENLDFLKRAIARTYASTLKPEALLYRRSKGLHDYDERMAILIQVVQGEAYGRYYLPHGAGVAFSRNLYRWSPDIRREDGFARLVWGLGTRAVERVGNDYPRLVALSHPTLQPDDSCEAIRRYSQQYVDLIDLQDNTFKTLPVGEVLRADYPALRFIAQLEEDGYFSTPRSRVSELELKRLAITYDELLRRTSFASLLSRSLRLLEEHYRGAVDVEFTVQVAELRSPKPQARLSLLQCRPQSILQAGPPHRLPKEMLTDAPKRVVFATHFTVPQGYLPQVRYVLFVPPEAYFALPSAAQRKALAETIGHLNALLSGEAFICVGPGRWGTLNTDLGVYVSYADICNAQALVELAGRGIGPAPEPSLGTHFFQDLMEAQIYPLAICLDHPEAVFNRAFFYDTPDHLGDWLGPAAAQSCLRLIDVQDYLPGGRLEIAMDDEQGLALAYLAPG